MLLSVIIINYNTFALTCDCIRSVGQTAKLPHEIILVDNNSRECAAEKFLEVFPNITLIALKENVGFGRANNRGVEAAKGEYVLLLNSDAVVHEGTVDKTVDYLERNPSVDVLGCKVMLDEHTVQATVMNDERETNLFSAIRYMIKRNSFFVETRLFLHNRKMEKAVAVRDGGSERNQTNTPSEGEGEITVNYYNGRRIGSLVGVYLLLKRAVFTASKGFDPDFFMYYEEIEWFVRRLRPYNIAYFPYATVSHFQGGSDVHKKMTLQFYVSQHLFWFKMGYPQYFFYLLFNLLDIPSRLLVKFAYKRPRLSQDIPEMLRALPYFFSVLRYRNTYGARREMLKLNYLQKHKL